MNRRRRVLAVLVLALAGVSSLGQGAWIYAKAGLAQVLLERSWHRARDGETRAAPWPWADTWPVARLIAPRLDEARIVLAGATGATLAFGPGHLDGSAAPGEPGNSVLAGHRDTHFRFLRHLEVGDELLLEKPEGTRFHYQVAERLVVDERDLAVLEDGGDRVLTLITCYPFDGVDATGSQRYVVRAVAGTG